MSRDDTRMRRVAVFPEINALPRAQRQPTMPHRNGEIDRGERSPNMCRHIIGAFNGVNEQAVAIRNEAREKGFQVASHIRIGIFLDEQGSRGVPEVKRDETVLDVVVRKPFGNFTRNFVKPTSAGRHVEIM